MVPLTGLCIADIEFLVVVGGGDGGGMQSHFHVNPTKVMLKLGWVLVVSGVWQKVKSLNLFANKHGEAINICMMDS